MIAGGPDWPHAWRVGLDSKGDRDLARTALGTAAMRVLPLGLPKIMISTNIYPH